MGDQVFVSYSRSDKEYVERLVEAFAERGIDCWWDLEIDYGSSFATVIEEKLESSAAVVVVMSPAAKSSKWVEREIHRAENKQRPVFPLLLDGEPFFLLAEIQHADVRDGALPSARWFDAIGKLVGEPEELRQAAARRQTEEREAEERRRAEQREAEQLDAAQLLAAQEAARRKAEEEARRRAEEERLRAEEEERRRRAEEEEARRRRRRAILIGIAAAVAVVVVASIIIVALSGGGGDGGGDGTQTADVTVPGDQAFTDTGVQCEAGGTLAITADGEVFHNEETSTGPDGDPGVPPEFNVVSGVPHAALIGRLDDGDPFLVGSRFAGTCQVDGALSLGINDAGTANNSGEFSATVELQPAG